MFCSKCGNKINDGAKFCASCGQPTGVGNTAESSPRQPDTREMETVTSINGDVLETGTANEKSGRKQKSKSMNPLMRVILFIVGVCLALLAIGTAAVGIFGESTKVTDISFTREKEDDSGYERYHYSLKYTYVVDGKEYVGTTTWKGSRDTPDSGYGEYHVNYLAVYPSVSRFDKHPSLIHARDAEDFVYGGGRTLLFTVLELGLSVLLMFAVFGTKITVKKKRRK